MTGMVKKYHIALFLEGGTAQNPVWVRIKKSTSLQLSLNPETQEYDYITDKNPTTEVIRYKPALNQPVTMYKGEGDYALAWDKFYTLKTGEKAKTNVLIVFMQEDVTRTVSEQEITAYKAWKNEATLSVSDLNAVDSTITLDINFGGKILHGYAYPDDTTHAPVFVQEEDPDNDWVDPFEPPAVTQQQGTGGTDGDGDDDGDGDNGTETNP